MSDELDKLWDQVDLKATTDNARVTARAYLRMRGSDPAEVPLDRLMAFGRAAARLGYARKLQPVKVREDGQQVHTWPVEVWDAAMGGQEAPARPASQRQVAYLAVLWRDQFPGRHVNDLLQHLDNEMSEDRAAELIKALGG